MNPAPDPVRVPGAYLDHAATTPMVAAAVAAVAEGFADVGNPSSLHSSGRAARRSVEESRELVAQAVGARPSEVVFTSGGTEADNIAVKGVFWARRDADPRRCRVLAPATEHHAVLDPMLWLAEAEGAKVDLLGVDSHGRLDLDALQRVLREDAASVALVSCMWANNEVGTVNRVAEVVDLAHEYGVPVHSDAVQAVGQLPVDFAASGLDAMTLTAHKLGGPIGAGALLLRRELDVVPLLHGGGQERQVRSGTLSAPLTAGFAAAVVPAVDRQPEQAARLEALRARMLAGIEATVPDIEVNGDPTSGPGSRLPGLVNVAFPGCEGDSLLMLLDAQGIACSTGSACTAGVPQASHVLLAMGRDEAAARSALRLSLGHSSTEADVDLLLDVLPAAAERARAAGLAGSRR
ncbi:MAG: Cysteine desulfurase [uncultured Nocardioidaceae bacterium]|uniref:cysteine desulfurase n=1 Tax=uncultured Nocardioidaceae bacterium TaxID=253824 RepID=A0A6J4M5H7_9ACTN|nr:MAG: Cysteine desulfurase [uncultured Nocardioidaceae bacterium]